MWFEAFWYFRRSKYPRLKTEALISKHKTIHRFLFWIFEYQRLQFYEACVFSLERIRHPFQNETSPFNRRLLSSKRDAATNVQCAMFNAQCSNTYYDMIQLNIENWTLIVECSEECSISNAQCSIRYRRSSRFSTALVSQLRSALIINQLGCGVAILVFEAEFSPR